MTDKPKRYTFLSAKADIKRLKDRCDCFLAQFKGYSAGLKDAEQGIKTIKAHAGIQSERLDGIDGSLAEAEKHIKELLEDSKSAKGDISALLVHWGDMQSRLNSLRGSVRALYWVIAALIVVLAGHLASHAW